MGCLILDYVDYNLMLLLGQQCLKALDRLHKLRDDETHTLTQVSVCESQHMVNSQELI